MTRPQRVLDPTRPEELARGMCALAVMTKAPQAGKVKTRLVPPLTHEEAAQLNVCFLRDVASAIQETCIRRPLADATRTDLQAQCRAPQPPARQSFGGGASEAATMARAIAVYTPRGAEAAYADVLPGDFSLVPQRGDGFGERLIFATEDLFKIGFASVCLINSDSPSVPAENFAQAVKFLRAPGDRVVLGPCEDGGYYLIGLNKPHRELFERIDWSTERVLDQTLQRASEIGLQAEMLAIGDDVDDRAALGRLCDELLTEDAPDKIALHTRKFLSAIISREGRTRIWPS